MVFHEIFCNPGFYLCLSSKDYQDFFNSEQLIKEMFAC